MRVSSSFLGNQSYTNLSTNSTNEKTEKKNEKAIQDKNKLSVEDLTTIAKLQARDTEVRAHEMAHQSAGGGLSGAPSYTYQRGPDGKMYAIGGEVPISMPSSNDPKKLAQDAKRVIAAAMAPANPSPQDYAVAANARSIEIKAEQEINQERLKEMEGKKEYATNSNYQDQDKTSSLDIVA